MNTRSKRPQRAPVSVGVTSLVLVFVMLCLIAFAVLSLVSAQANLRLSRKSAERTTAWYAAENAANDVLIALQPILAANADAPDAESYFAAVRAAVPDELGVTFSDDGHLAWQVPVEEAQSLQVEVELLYPLPEEGPGWRVLRWQTVPQYDWQAEQPLELMRPGDVPIFE